MTKKYWMAHAVILYMEWQDVGFKCACKNLGVKKKHRPIIREMVDDLYWGF